MSSAISIPPIYKTALIRLALNKAALIDLVVDLLAPNFVSRTIPALLFTPGGCRLIAACEEQQKADDQNVFRCRGHFFALRLLLRAFRLDFLRGFGSFFDPLP
jgi:hypothetical protein